MLILISLIQNIHANEVSFGFENLCFSFINENPSKIKKNRQLHRTYFANLMIVNQKSKHNKKQDEEIRQRVLEHDGHVFLRAGAGAGKSTLLAQKIAKLVAQGKSLEQMAAITFTNKSALDLKWKIESKLMEELALQKDEQKSKHLQEQIKKIPESLISTIHSFCSYFLFQYPVLAQVDPAAKSLNQEQEKNFLEGFIEQYLLALEHNDREEKKILLSFWLDVFSAKILSGGHNGNMLKTLLSLNQYNRQIINFDISEMMINDPQQAEELSQEWYSFLKQNFEKVYDCLAVENEIMKSIYDAMQKENFSEAQADLKKRNVDLRKFQTGEKNFKIFDKEKCSKLFDSAIAHVQCYFVARFCIVLLQDKMSMQKMEKDWTAKKLQDYLTKKYSKTHLSSKEQEQLKDFFYFHSQKHTAVKGIFFSDEPFAQEYLRFQLITVLQDFFIQYQKHKRQNGVIDFADQLFYMLDFVKTDRGKNKIQEKIQYLFVDEYQDTDPIQTKIFLRIADFSSSTIKTKLFRVGDHKQSIYRFRGANVHLYQSEFDEFERLKNKQEKHNKQPFDFLSENLQINFRSLPQLTQFYNTVFSHEQSPLMLSNYQDMFSIKENNKKPTVYVGFENNEKKESKNQKELEAEWICQSILNIKKANAGNSKSIALLFSGMNDSSLSHHIDAFQKHKIPYYIHGRKFYLQAFPFRDFTLLIQTLAFANDITSLVGWLRSPSAGFSDEEVYKLQNTKNILENLGKTKNLKFLDELDKDLAQKTEQASQLIFLLQEIYSFYGLRDLVYAAFKEKEFLQRSCYYKKSDDFLEMFSSALEIISQVENEKDSLRVFSKRLQELIGVVRDDAELDIGSIQESLSENQIAVHMMSIHAAKGLEFDNVFVPSLKFSTDRTRNNIIYGYQNQNETSRFVLHFKQDIASGQMGTSPFDYNHEEAKNERVRLYYVAFTRAKENLFLFVQKEKGFLGFLQEQFADEKSGVQFEPFDMAEEPPSKNKNQFLVEQIPTFSQDQKTIVQGVQYFSATSLLQEKQHEEKEEIDIVESSFDMEHNNTEIPYHVEFKDILWGQGNFKKFNARKRGVFIHQMFEWIDLKNPQVSNELVLAMLKSQMINLEDEAKVKKQLQEVLLTYRNSQLFEWVQKAKILGKEVGFSWQQQEKMAIGYIDLLLEKNNDIYVVDYKTNKITKEKDNGYFISQYQESMKLYNQVVQSYFADKKVFSYLYMSETGKLLKVV